MTIITPLTLSPLGEREVVDGNRAKQFISQWKEQIQTHRTQYENATTPTTETGKDHRQSSPLVEKINLSNKSYTSAAAKIIADFFDGEEELVKGLKIVDMSDVIASRMEDEGLEVLKTLCDAFKVAALEEVDLSDNAMGCKGISACSSLLSGQSSSLQRLSLCNNGLSEASMSEVADILCKEEPNGSICSRLTKIHFYNNMSGNGGCEAFGRIMSQCTSSLTDIRFSGTRAGREGSLIISNSLYALAKSSSLQNLARLDLADNAFYTEGGTILAKALRYAPNLKYLNLRDCLLKDEAAGLVCRSIWGCDAALEHLDMSGNELTRKGAKDVADLVEELGKCLRVLYLEENEIKSHGATYVAQALGQRVEEVKLGSNEIGRMGAQALIMAYGDGEEFENLRIIDLNGNFFMEEDEAALVECFGDKLPEMDDNIDDEDIDEGLSDVSEDEEEEEDEDEEPKSRDDILEEVKKRMEELKVENSS